VYPPVSYSSGEPFGGTGAHLLVADCGEGQYRTEGEFVELPEEE